MTRFIFKDNNNIICDCECFFQKNLNDIEFSYQDEQFNIKFDNNGFIMKKVNQNSVFTICKNGEKNSSSLYLKDNDICFNIDVLFLDFCRTDEYIRIVYKTVTDDKSLKTLEIRY